MNTCIRFYLRISLALVISISACSPILSQSLDIPLVSLSESAVVYAPVDEIHFSFDIQTHAKDVSAARNKNRAIADKAFSFLKSKGVDDRYIQTKRMRVSKNYIRNNREKKYDGYNTYQHIYVCIKDIDSYDFILDSLLTMDIGTITGPTLKSTKYDSLMQVARIDAVKKAKKNAYNLAQALGQSIGYAKLIKSSISYNSGQTAYTSGKNSNTNGPSDGSSFRVGEIEIMATVEVSFELLE